MASIRKSGYSSEHRSLKPPRVKVRLSIVFVHFGARRAPFLFAFLACATIASIGTIGPARAEPTAEASALPEIARVVTSDRRSAPIGESSRPTFVVDRSRIEAYGARTVAEALVGVPGVELFSYGAFGSLTNYGIRGAGSESTLVLIDGIPITDPTTGSVQLGQLSTVGIDRIEVVESGSSTLYGTSAVGGVINVVTRVPRGTYLAASTGSFADRDLRASVGTGQVGLDYERHVATNAYGYPALTYSPSSCSSFASGPCKFPAGVRTNGNGDETTVRLNADVAISSHLRVRARVDDAVTQAGFPGRLDFLSTTATGSNAMKSALVDIEKTSAHDTLTVSVGGSQTRSTFVDLPTNFGESDVYSGRTQFSIRDAISGKHTDAVIGVDLARESGSFSFPTTPDFASSSPTAPPIAAFGVGAKRSLSAAYVQIGSTLRPGARLTAGLRAENDAPFGSVLAPSFGGVIRTGKVRFAGDIGETFRVPTLQDLYYPGASNPNLRPEKSSNADATIAFDTATASYSVGYFGRSGSNFIVFDPVAFVPVNARRAQTAGLVFTATSRALAGVVVEANYTDLYRALDLTTGARLPRNPVGQASISLRHAMTARDRVGFELRYGIVGSDGDDAANRTGPAAGTFDAYDSLDANLHVRIARDAVLTLRGTNLGDTRAAPIFGYPAPGRRFAVELSTR